MLSFYVKLRLISLVWMELEEVTPVILESVMSPLAACIVRTGVPRGRCKTVPFGFISRPQPSTTYQKLRYLLKFKLHSRLR